MDVMETQGQDRLIAGRYRLTGDIGHGGMASVFRAEDTLLHRTVAIKMLYEQFAADPSFLERFRREARAAAGLSHPSIVAVYDLGEQQGRPYIVMEYVEGVSLKEVIQQHGALTAARAVPIVMQVCSALEYAHSKGIIHRDVKPQNILVPRGVLESLAYPSDSAGPPVKITDFGIARATADISVSATGEVLGSVHYVAPEQARGERATPQTDVYSAGVVLYELLTGKLPFESDTALGVAIKHLQEAPPAPRTYNPQIPPMLEGIVLQALAKEPDQRFPSARDLEQALQRYQEFGGGATASLGPVAAAARQASPSTSRAAVAVPPPAPAPYAARSSPWPRRLFLLTLIVLTIVWLIGLGLTISAFMGSSPQVLLQARATEPPQVEPTATGAPEVLIPGLGGLAGDQAKRLLESMGLVYREDGSRFDPVALPGTVVEQQPATGQRVSGGDTVAVVLSRGPQPVAVPKAVSLPAEQAKQVVAAAGLVAQVEEHWHAQAQKGTVYSQEPGEGKNVAPGSAVVLLVSKGPELVRMPDVVGQKEQDAKRTIEAAQLKNASFVNYQGHAQLSDDVLKKVCVGCVLSSDPQVGAEVAPGAVVNLAVRKD